MWRADTWTPQYQYLVSSIDSNSSLKKKYIGGAVSRFLLSTTVKIIVIRERLFPICLVMSVSIVYWQLQLILP